MLLTFPIYECHLIPTACCEVGSNIISHLKTRKRSLYEVQGYRASKWEKRDLTLNRRIPGFTFLTTVFVRILRINRINRIYTSIHIHRERETLVLRNWLMWLCQGRVVVHTQTQSAGRIPSCLREVSLCSIQAFKWLDETHACVEGKWFCSKVTNLNVNLIQKQFSQKYPT